MTYRNSHKEHLNHFYLQGSVTYFPSQKLMITRGPHTGTQIPGPWVYLGHLNCMSPKPSYSLSFAFAFLLYTLWFIGFSLISSASHVVAVMFQLLNKALNRMRRI